MVGGGFIININTREIECGLDSTCSRCGRVAVSCEHGNKPSGTITGGKFLD
jgi:hypothetical protein